jgi:hypothetical protein
MGNIGTRRQLSTRSGCDFVFPPPSRAGTRSDESRPRARGSTRRRARPCWWSAENASSGARFVGVLKKIVGGNRRCVAQEPPRLAIPNLLELGVGVPPPPPWQHPPDDDRDSSAWAPGDQEPRSSSAPRRVELTRVSTRGLRAHKHAALFADLRVPTLRREVDGQHGRLPPCRTARLPRSRRRSLRVWLPPFRRWSLGVAFLGRYGWDRDELYVLAAFAPSRLRVRRLSVADRCLSRAVRRRFGLVDAAHAELSLATADPLTVIGLPRMFQLWARRPAPCVHRFPPLWSRHTAVARSGSVRGRVAGSRATLKPGRHAPTI